jgi:hypothetical protein
MKYFLVALLFLILGFVGASRYQNFDLSSWIVGNFREVRPNQSGSVVLDFLAVSPVKKIATLEVESEHTLVDDYFDDYKILDFDTPAELDKFLSQINILGKVKVRAIYGYTADQIGTLEDVQNRGNPQLLYYEIIDNNIEQVVVGLGISSNTVVERVVNVVLAGIHDDLKTEYANNSGYILQAKQNALCKFDEICL